MRRSRALSDRADAAQAVTQDKLDNVKRLIEAEKAANYHIRGAKQGIPKRTAQQRGKTLAKLNAEAQSRRRGSIDERLRQIRDETLRRDDG